MFQSFEDASEGHESAGRIARLREALGTDGLDGFIVPRADEHQGEYIPPSAARLAWLTGFTGSAGNALILQETAVLFTDGRYTVQVRAQSDGSVFEFVNSVEMSLSDYLAEHGAGLKIGIDPWLHTMGEVGRLRAVLGKVGGELILLSTNPIDRLWQDRPLPPIGQVTLHPTLHAGLPVGDKIEILRNKLASAGADAVLLTDPSSMAWAFNIRGSDVPHTPLPLGFALVPASGNAVVFLDERKISAAVRGALADHIEFAPPTSLEARLGELATGTRFLLDPNLAAQHLADVIRKAGGTIVEGEDPARLPRAIKNETELDGARRAHLRDAVAMVTFLAWMDAQPHGSLTEIDAAMRLEAIRAETGERDGMPLRDISFDTISAAGPNAALPHYRVNASSNRSIEGGELFLVDSGGQYEDGTTDITRTIAVGTPSDAMRKHFTLVLKGVIAVSRARFPVGTRGMDLDPLARFALWQNGCDYAHGTGHGVGSFLAVHEGPQSISRRGTAVLEPGMIVSNEPGYYREGSYGIRTENLLVVTQAEDVSGGDLPMHRFETLTFVPIDNRLVARSLLNPDEIAWLDAYHRDVRERLIARLTAGAREWLENATRPIG
ncbi:aminopeptidase P family protein [Aureimonas jatrophae]|uniref:Xaa-Pro aminopeptidase n=1 Tax=Aureimonas jatrophae TaxID=1166073 RepID=A0A1H0GR26_9HYPH|nr:aminopeptidase P family protein [Aureimonas jatrophae]MBB3949729.1 Xaa-Pro aminopeptidase [Aureimonas jatrophae]SDO09506.1 Xaa-Pro aminopeptidase [Aureimonas jatrophae]